MSSGEKPPIFVDTPSFSAVLDHACEELWEQKVQYSIARIRGMEEKLKGLEQDLDMLISRQDRNGE